MRLGRRRRACCWNAAEAAALHLQNVAHGGADDNEPRSLLKGLPRRFVKTALRGGGGA